MVYPWTDLSGAPRYSGGGVLLLPIVLMLIGRIRNAPQASALALTSAPLVAAWALFLVAGIGVYAMSAFEAHRLAQGGDLLVETKVLMWALVGVVFVGVGLLVFGVVTATHR